VRILERTVYTFDELSDEAKQRARQAFVEQPGYPHEDWWSFDDFERAAACLGVEFKRRSEKKPRFGESPICLYFSGFSSQGDGASFEGTYRCRPDAVKAITEYAPQDEALKAIAEELSARQVKTKMLCDEVLAAEITTSSSNYCHSNTMNATVYSLDENGDNVGDASEDEEEIILTLMRRFADWIYDQLEDQYNWHFSNECVDEQLLNSGDEFDVDGTII
jgi:hypothetical protein